MLQIKNKKIQDKTSLNTKQKTETLRKIHKFSLPILEHNFK